MHFVTKIRERRYLAKFCLNRHQITSNGVYKITELTGKLIVNVDQSFLNVNDFLVEVRGTSNSIQSAVNEIQKKVFFNLNPIRQISFIGKEFSEQFSNVIKRFIWANCI